MRPWADNARALSWLESALKHTRDRGQRRLEYLLETVQADIVLEMRLTDGVFDGRPPTGQEIDER